MARNFNRLRQQRLHERTTARSELESALRQKRLDLFERVPDFNDLSFTALPEFYLNLPTLQVSLSHDHLQRYPEQVRVFEFEPGLTP